VDFSADPQTPPEVAKERYMNLLKFDQRWPVFERKASEIVMAGLQQVLNKMHQPWYAGYPQGKMQEPPYYYPQHWPLFPGQEPRTPW